MKKYKSRNYLTAFKIVLTYLVILFLGTSTIYGLFTYKALAKVSRTDINVKYNDSAPDKSNIENIAIFAVQRRENSSELYPESNPDLSRGFAKSIFILTLDKEKDEARISAIDKNISVHLENYGFDRLEKSYQIGTPELTLNSLNERFNLNINKFITLNFDSIPNLIDGVEGINLDLTNEDINYINNSVKTLDLKDYDKPFNILENGNNSINGIQGREYMISFPKDPNNILNELIYPNKTDALLKGILYKLNTCSASSLPLYIYNLSDFAKTNMSKSELANVIFDLNRSESFKFMNFPNENNKQGYAMLNEMNWHTPYNFESTKAALEDFIFNGVYNPNY